MEENLYFGLMLMAVGMTTVFVILALVVLGGKVTLLLTNRYSPAPAATPVVAARPAAGEKTAGSRIAAITAVVEVITGGRGHIKEIKKSDH